MEISSTPGVLCGGARSGPNCVQAYPGDRDDGWVSMQGSAYGEAYPGGEGRLHAVWYSTYLMADVPGVGRCVMHYAPDPPSTVSITARSGRSDSFFPADAEQTLHYVMTVVDGDGVPVRELVTDRPVRMSATIDAIPPVGVGFAVAETLVFSDARTGEPVVVLRGGSHGLVLPSGGLAVDLTDEPGVAADDTLALSVTITPTGPGLADAEAGAEVWWAVTGHNLELAGSRALVRRARLGDPSPLRVDATFDPASDGTRMVVVHAWRPGAAPDDLMEAHAARRV